MSTSRGPEQTGPRPHVRPAGTARAKGRGRPGLPEGSGERRHSRERALELSYEAEQKGLTVEELLSELPVVPGGYALELVTGLSERIDEVDGLIAFHSAGWAIDRMPAVDRCILRLATYELVAEPSVPLAVVIDEAVELAKEYSTEDSPRFVNGVLAAIADAVRLGLPEAAPSAGAGDGAGDGGAP